MPSGTHWLSYVVLFALAGCGSSAGPVTGGGSLADASTMPTPVGATTDAMAPSFVGADGGGAPGSAPPAPTDGGCGAVSAAAELTRQPVDIIWAIDGSGSMGDSILAVADNLNRFVTSIEASGTSAHTVLNVPANLTAAPIGLLAASLDPTRFQWVQGDIGSHNAFDVLLETFPQYRAFLRADAPTHIIVVTDDDNNLPWLEFQTRMTALLGHPFIFHAIASPPANPCAGASSESPDYYALAQATGGQQIRLCDDWSAIFPILQAAVVATAPVPCEFAIPAPPNGETLNPDAVQVLLNIEGLPPEQFPRAGGEAACGAARAWHYDLVPNPSKVVLCREACTAVQTGGRISVSFGCAPIQLR